MTILLSTSVRVHVSRTNRLDSLCDNSDFRELLRIINNNVIMFNAFLRSKPICGVESFLSSTINNCFVPPSRIHVNSYHLPLPFCETNNVYGLLTLTYGYSYTDRHGKGKSFGRSFNIKNK